jgi:hypothetical protein
MIIHLFVPFGTNKVGPIQPSGASNGCRDEGRDFGARRVAPIPPAPFPRSQNRATKEGGDRPPSPRPLPPRRVRSSAKRLRSSPVGTRSAALRGTSRKPQEKGCPMQGKDSGKWRDGARTRGPLPAGAADATRSRGAARCACATGEGEDRHGDSGVGLRSGGPKGRGTFCPRKCLTGSASSCYTTPVVATRSYLNERRRVHG